MLPPNGSCRSISRFRQDASADSWRPLHLIVRQLLNPLYSLPEKPMKRNQNHLTIRISKPFGFMPSTGIFQVAFLMLVGSAPQIVFAEREAIAAEGGSRSPEWQVVFKDDFDGRKELGEGFERKDSSIAGWSVDDGVMSARQNRPEHGTVMRRSLAYSDMRCEFDFRFIEKQTWGTLNIVFDDSQEKSVHSGHITRVSISRNRIYLSDDKLGSMNLEVRKLRKLQDLSDTQKKELARRLEGTAIEKKMDISDDGWHHVVITVSGPTLRVMFDGKEVGVLESPGIDHPTRNKYGFTVSGKTGVQFDNWVVSVPASAKNASK